MFKYFVVNIIDLYFDYILLHKIYLCHVIKSRLDHLLKDKEEKKHKMKSLPSLTCILPCRPFHLLLTF